MSRHLNVVVQSTPFYREVGRNGEASGRRGARPSGRPQSSGNIFISGPDLGAWPDCWVSVELLHAPITRKGSGNTKLKTTKCKL